MKMLNFNDYSKTLESLSLDSSNGEPMVHCQEHAIDFDAFLEAYFKQCYSKKCSKVPESVDAVLFVDGKYTLIEFKNGRMDKEKCHNVKCKIAHSLLVIMDHQNIGIDYVKNNISFVLVYNNKTAFKKEPDLKQYKKMIASGVMQKAKTRIIHFGLDIFKETYFKDVLTIEKDEFQDFLNAHEISFPQN